MKSILKIFAVIVCCGIFNIADVNAVVLQGSMSVTQSSDTAADAKIKAINSARRQILISVLSKYADSEALQNLIQEASSDELAVLISSSSVANEQISADTYSAKISMDIDNDAVKQWLDEKGVQNWIPSKESAERFSVFIVVQNGIADWAELKRITRESGIEIETKVMQGNQITAKLPLNYRTKFTAAIRENGWKYADNNGTLQIWK